ncbi:MAG: VOC family protein [Thermomicrobiales bacterium]
MSVPITINHLNLAVRDVPATRAFFCTHLGFTCGRPHDALSILDNSAGFVLTLMPLKEDDPAAYPGSFHVGFYVPEATVEAMHASLTSAGYEPGEISRLHRGTMFYVTDPSGILVEVCCPR